MHATLTHDLDGLRVEWQSLWSEDPLAAPFLSWDWLSTWTKHWSDGGTPWIVAVRDDRQLVGLALFQLGNRKGLRFLTGLGVGFGDYWDVIASPADRARVTAEVAGALGQWSEQWDALVIDKLPEDSLLPAAMREAGLRLRPAVRLPAPRVVLPDAFDAYLGGLSKNRRWRLRRNLKAIDGGELAIRAITDPGELRTALERWQALRVQWWEKRERDMMGEHGSPRFLAFTQGVVAALVPDGRAIVWEVSRGEELVGVTVNFLDEHTFYYWLWGFDARFEDLRPGHTLIAYGIRWSIETGRRYFDFMIGGEDYKYDYGPEDRSVLAMTVGNSTVRSRIALGLGGVKQVMGTARSRIRARKGR